VTAVGGGVCCVEPVDARASAEQDFETHGKLNGHAGPPAAHTRSHGLALDVRPADNAGVES
jgi:hypothetical protein